MYKEGVALKRKIVFPLFRTINVCGEEKENKPERKQRQNNKEKEKYQISCKQRETSSLIQLDFKK